MAKKKQFRTEKQPTAMNVDFPVVIPDENGGMGVDIGKARLRAGTLVVEFGTTAASVAVQRMIERGVLMGVSMIMIKPDEVNEKYQEVVAEEELEKDLNELFEKEDTAATEENTEVRSDDVDR